MGFYIRLRFAIVLIVLPFVVPDVIADEADDTVAKRYVAIVRDPRLALRVRVAAARALSSLGPRAAAAAPELTEQLSRFTKDELESLQIAVIESLGDLGSASRTSLPDLVRCIGRSTDIDQAITLASSQIRTSGDSLELDVLQTQLRSRDVSTRLRAVKALSLMKSRAASAVPGLTILLADADGDIRRATISALNDITPQSLPKTEIANALVFDLTDSDEGIRYAAVKRLGKLGKEAGAVAGKLEPLLAHVDRDVRKAAVDALARIAAP